MKPQLDFPGDELRFSADIMLKRLAKYLRALGYDTLFNENLPDHELLEASKREERVLLTRDKALCREAPDLYSFYVKPQHPEAQLDLVAKYYPVSYEESRFVIRCLECNTPLTEMEKGEAKGRVPDRIYEYQDQFFRCRMCNQVFWHGDHVKRLRGKLRNILGKD